MKTVRHPASWLLYWTGHVLSIAMRTRPLGFLYYPDQWLMLASVACQGDRQRGPWGPPAEAGEDVERALLSK